ncbi:hypothetical protein VFPFJ_07882 [Purpureocillium lilacinum]|uniref:Uncharacterized protein n=1 Tax=Purpureocillium lilacinum TaxID=33203 RepID=A0A179H7H2_PURLI|nr:hypothetical protein VFPFJ_07882 [Purpureocillium lilacinum]OAQ85493.1 hypothetical protein VFPFJ_07882 [Purpureocillium lilacinum]
MQTTQRQPGPPGRLVEPSDSAARMSSESIEAASMRRWMGWHAAVEPCTGIHHYHGIWAFGHGLSRPATAEDAATYPDSSLPSSRGTVRPCVRPVASSAQRYTMATQPRTAS